MPLGNVGIGPFSLDLACSDHDALHVDVEGLGTVVVKVNEDGVGVDVYPHHTLEKPVASCWVPVADLTRPEDPAFMQAETYRPPIRVVCTSENLSSYGLFGTVVGSERGEGISRESHIKPGVLFDVIWLDYPDEGTDEIDGGNLKVVSEATFQIEVVERKLDGGE